jgi:membrane dipeptidase
VPDDVLDRVKANGGVVMATFVPNFISRKSHEWMSPLQIHGKTRPGVDIDNAVALRAAESGPWPRGSIPELCDHIQYIVGRTGLAHIGIGSDFYGGPNPPDLADASRFPDLVAELIRRGWSDAALKGLLSGNVLRVWRQVEASSRKLATEEPPRVARVAAEHLGRPPRKKPAT